MLSETEFELCNIAVLRNTARRKALEGFTQEAYDAGLEFLLAWQEFHNKHDTLPMFAEVFTADKRVLACLVPGSLKVKRAPQYAMMAWWYDEDGDLCKAPSTISPVEVINTFLELVESGDAILILHDIREGTTLLPEIFHYEGERRFHDFWGSRVPEELLDSIEIDPMHDSTYDKFIDLIAYDRNFYLGYRDAKKRLEKSRPGGKCPTCAGQMRLVDSQENANHTAFICEDCGYTEELSEEATLTLLEDEDFPDDSVDDFVDGEVDTLLPAVYASDGDDEVTEDTEASDEDDDYQSWAEY